MRWFVVTLLLACLSCMVGLTACSERVAEPVSDDTTSAEQHLQQSQTGQEAQPSSESQAPSQPQAASTPQDASPNQATPGQEEQPSVSQQESEPPTDNADEAAPFDPDAMDMSQLIFWGPADGFFGRFLPIPTSGQDLLDELLASDSYAIDKYVIDLAAFPNPYWGQVLDYLNERYGRSHRTVYEYPEIFEFDPRDSVTPSYLRFKQALFGSQFTDMAEMMNPDEPIVIDAREIMWGGVRVDGIPPLEFPAQVQPDEAAEWILEDDLVVGVEIAGDARAYPIRIIAWHEMVNDTIGGVPVSLAYCTLCGSAILFDGRVGDAVYRFGTSGLLYRSNKLMYDRTTRTLWNQFSGRPAWGPLVSDDIRLSVLPAVVTTWSEWYEQHPDTTVLSINTGFIRDYGSGVAYNEYFNSPNTWFNVPEVDDRLAQKDDVFVVRVGEALTAYPISVLAERGIVIDEVGGLAIVVIATADGEGGRAYETGDVQFESAHLSHGTLTNSDGGVWMIRENSLLGPDGERLPRVGGHNAYWFAITNQTPEGRLWVE